MFLIEEGSADEIPGVNSPDVDVVNKPTGVIMGGPQADRSQDAGRVRCGRNSNTVFDTALDEDPKWSSEAAPCPLQPFYFNKWDIFANTYSMPVPFGPSSMYF